MTHEPRSKRERQPITSEDVGDLTSLLAPVLVPGVTPVVVTVVPTLLTPAVEQITVGKFVRSVKGDLGAAYAHVESLRPVRKMSQEEWQADYDAWLAAPRR